MGVWLCLFLLIVVGSFVGTFMAFYVVDRWFL